MYSYILSPRILSNRLLSGTRFGVRWDVLSWDLVGSQGSRIGGLDCRVALVFEGCLGSTAAERLAKFQSDRAVLGAGLTAWGVGVGWDRGVGEGVRGVL